MAGLDKKQVFAVFGVWLKLSVDILKIHMKVHQPTISAICKKVKWQKRICTAGFFFHFQINRVSKIVVKYICSKKETRPFKEDPEANT